MHFALLLRTFGGVCLGYVAVAGCGGLGLGLVRCAGARERQVYPIAQGFGVHGG